MMSLALLDFVLREQGCVVCFAMGFGVVPCAKHHLLTTGHHGNGKRRGERAVVGLCDYHHQGAAAVGTAMANRLRATRGPSYADNAREFRALWPDSKLQELQAERIKEWQGRHLGCVT